jgi:uncharacterized membrane protein YdbT with pleckstrin-like domain
VQMRPHWSALSAPLLVSLAAVALGVALDVVFPRTTSTVHWIEGVVVTVPCLWLAVRATRWWYSSLILTPARLIQRWGVVVRGQGEVPLAQIEEVTAIQSVVRHLFGTGRLELVIRGESGVRWIDDVRKPDVVERVIARRLAPIPPPGWVTPPAPPA